MHLLTPRLRLLPLTESQLTLWLNDITLLESEINMTYRAEPITGFFRDIIVSQLDKLKLDSDNWIWHTFWLLIRKSDEVAVGSADFKAPPDQSGVVEIGYGLGADFTHNGYMTEAVKAMVHWAFSQSQVKMVVAETELTNIASQNILRSCGFQLEKSNESLWWKLENSGYCKYNK